MTINSDHQSRYSTPLDRVDAMVSEYESIKEPSHGLRHIRDNFRLYSSFCDLIKHHIGLIMSRPKAIEDGHVTVYDKCLLELCRNGKYVDGLAGQEFFIREFMGIDPDSRLRRDVEDMIDREISVKDELLRCSSQIICFSFTFLEADTFIYQPLGRAPSLNTDKSRKRKRLSQHNPL
ncbi:hypothetical protein EIK77_005390 [Talaromyces pinophilus]|nr:hypothetical protein EIK77_005390 [Talaromyces pinophilus]